MTDYVLEQIINCARRARSGGFDVLSTGERLAAAMVLNRADWIAEMNYTLADAIVRIGPVWMAQIPDAARILEEEACRVSGSI
jgi:hypothetical protein